MIASLMLIPVLFVSFGNTVAQAKSRPAPVNTQGLQLLEGAGPGTVYIDPKVDLGTYQRVWLLDATVAFKKNWQRDQNRTDPFKVSDRDMERISEDVSTTFRQVMTQELQAAGYTVVTAAAADVLKIKPAVFDLDVIAPDELNATNSYNYSESAGEMSLKLELYDSVTHHAIGVITDHKRDYRQDLFELRTSASNRGDMRRMIRAWAKELRTTLDGARKVVSNAD